MRYSNAGAAARYSDEESMSFGSMFDPMIFDSAIFDTARPRYSLALPAAMYSNAGLATQGGRYSDELAPADYSKDNET